MKKKDGDEIICLDKIKAPSFLKLLDYKELNSLASSLREEIIRATSLYGGHLSSNLGVVEITIALNRVFDPNKDKIIYDVGHQCYAQKILTGRSLDHLNQRGFCNGFQNRFESSCDVYDAGHSSTSLSAAEAFAFARDLNKENYDVVALIGDASIVNGLSFEALNNIAERHNKVIIVLNDNDMSINRPVGGMGKFFRKVSTARLYNKTKTKFMKAMSKTHVGRKIYGLTYAFKRALKYHLIPTTMFDNMGFTYIGPVDGHNIKALEKAMRSAKISTKSVVIHCRTIKGKGYSFAENDKKGLWHGVSPFDVATGKAKNAHEGETSWPSYFGDLIKEVLKKDENAVLVTAATSVGSKLEECFKEYKARCIDVGIAEEHALTFSGALSISGKHPIVSLYSTFAQRAYDEIAHDCARMGANLTLLLDRAGFSGKNGETHQGLYDVAFLRSIPNVTVAMPSDRVSAKFLFAESLKDNGVFAIRYPNEWIDESDTVMPSIRLGLRLLAKNGDGAAYLCVGPKGKLFAFKAKEENIEGTFFDPVILSRTSEEDIDLLLSFPKIFIFDPYGVKEGYAEGLIASLCEKGYKGQIKTVAAPLKFVKFGTVDEQEEECGVSLRQTLEQAKAF